MRLRTSPITWILFDVGNVLVDFRPGGLSRIADSLGIPPELIYSFFNESDVGERIGTGQLKPEEFVDFFNHQFHCSVTPADIVTWFGSEVAVVYPEIPALIDLLRQRYSIGILSNTFFGHWDYFVSTNLAQKFDAPMASHLLGYRKPDPRIFRAALENIKAAPSEILFVDDKIENVEAARGLGIQAFVARGGREVIQGFQQLGFIGEDIANNRINAGQKR